MPDNHARACTLGDIEDLVVGRLGLGTAVTRLDHEAPGFRATGARSRFCSACGIRSTTRPPAQQVTSVAGTTPSIRYCSTVASTHSFPWLNAVCPSPCAGDEDAALELRRDIDGPLVGGRRVVGGAEDEDRGCSGRRDRGRNVLGPERPRQAREVAVREIGAEVRRGVGQRLPLLLHHARRCSAPGNRGTSPREAPRTGCSCTSPRASGRSIRRRSSGRRRTARRGPW